MRYVNALMFVMIAAAASRADDWPQWMGPKRDNVWREKGIIDAFPKDGPKVLWRAKVSNGFSGPAVADGLVFLTDFVSKADITADNFDREKFAGIERVHCFDAKTGDQKWKHEYPVTYTVSYPNGPRTPNYEAGKVYTLGARRQPVLLRGGNRQDRLVTRFQERLYGQVAALGLCAAHPLIDGNRLICLVGGEGSLVVAFDKSSGKEIWKALTPGENGVGYSPPTIVEAGGTRQLLIWHPVSLNGLNPETGKVYWSVDQATENGTSIMAPRVLDNFIFLGAWMRKGQMLKLDADKPGATTV